MSIFRRRKKRTIYNPLPKVDGVYSQDVEQCSTCRWWTVPRRKRTCKRNRVVEIGGRRITGTPADYLCGEYSPRNVATCGDCTYWTDERRPYKRLPCSKLSLVDSEGRTRTEKSLYCRYYDQRMPWNIANNANLRVDSSLVSVIDLERHSEPVAFILRQDPFGGLLCVWKPSGPGEGEWTVLPVGLTDVDEGDLELKQYIDVSRPYQSSEVAFDGTAKLEFGPLGNEEVEGQEERTIFGTFGQSVKKGLAAIRIAMKIRRPRIFDEDAEEDVEEDESERKESPRSMQDEVWGIDWDDLKAQLALLMHSGGGIGESALAVQRAYFRERTGSRMSSTDAKRLQRQLVEVGRGIRDGKGSVKGGKG